MAQWDHVRDDETNPARSRRDAAHFAWSDGPAFLRRNFGPPRSNNDNQPHIIDEGPADELDCLRRVLAPELLRAAAARARELGVGADQVLIRQGVIGEEAYLQRLALHTGIAIENFSEIGHGDSLLRDREILQAAELCLIRLWRDGRLIWALAPRRLAARMLCRLVAKYPDLTEWLRLASSSHLHQFLLHQPDDALGRAAANGLRRRLPRMSAAPAAVEGPRWRRFLQRFKRPFGIAALMLLPPIIALDVWSIVLALWFLAFIGLRLYGSFVPRLPQPKLHRLPDHQLPVYTVIAALYREAKSVAPLMQAIDAFDYPREKLQVILVLEPNDLATRAAIARLGPMPHVQVLVAPATGPQTKPKALNCALAFVRGSFTAVFDAEDRPDPGQLRAALDVFRGHDTDVACAQASLCIDNNNKDSWLSRTFAAEYAGQFDIFLPGLAAMRMPLPLGGSSNHFRTAVLREVGGWDAWNVTEDADLGFRLARFGYRSVTFDSTTNEEAPIRFKAWLGQRSRWMKGWMQTWSVHMREPRRLWREAGPRGFLTLNIIVGGNVLTALAYPILVVEFAAYLVTTAAAIMPGWFFTGSLAPLHIATIAAGFVSTVVIGLMGLARRAKLRSGWVLAATPVYWAYLSIAAWRALWQLWRDPYHWEKTEHGLTQSRQSTEMPRAQATTYPHRRSGRSRAKRD
ncbi:MAG: glycosyltransferase XagB [Bradyrhizobium sp.]|jgi:cellulose synthase/poly-beta-1,6-N-acetylglucosamine synthase-like glycosyltransferase|nr:glycosyltransferase XagB [Bradyrhizobium sp.]